MSLGSMPFPAVVLLTACDMLAFTTRQQSKAASAALLTQTLAAQYGTRGIRSNLVAPGVIKTDMTKDYWDAPAFQRLNQEMTPLERDCTTNDVANAVFFLASEQGSYINGQTLALDGGWSTTKYLKHQALVCQRVENS